LHGLRRSHLSEQIGEDEFDRELFDPTHIVRDGEEAVVNEGHGLHNVDDDDGIIHHHAQGTTTSCTILYINHIIYCKRNMIANNVSHTGDVYESSRSGTGCTKLYIDDSIDYREAIFIFLLHTRSNARGILIVVRIFRMRLILRLGDLLTLCDSASSSVS
jgi:hypothetical protein